VRGVAERCRHKASGRSILALLTPGVCSVELSWCQNIGPDIVHNLGERCPSLHTLKLAGCAGVNDAWTHSLSSLPNLTNLDISNNAGLTTIGVATVVTVCTSLQRLNLSGIDDVEDVHVCAAITNMPNLSTLVLKGCRSISDHAFLGIPDSPNLSAVLLKGCSQLSGTVLAPILSHATNLTSLHLTGVRATPHRIRQLQDLTRLESIKLGECDLSNGALSSLRSLSRLRRLDVSWCEDVCDVDVVAVASTCPLQTLRARMCVSLTDVSLDVLGPSLTKLDMSGCELLTNDGLTSLAKNCPHLVHCNLSWCSLLSSPAIIGAIRAWTGATPYTISTHGAGS